MPKQYNTKLFEKHPGHWILCEISNKGCVRLAGKGKFEGGVCFDVLWEKKVLRILYRMFPFRQENFLKSSWLI